MIGEHDFTETKAGIVTDLFLCEMKGCPPHPTEELHLLAGAGILGDIHAKGGPRQVSMLSREAAEWMDKQETPGLCFKRHKANIRVEGFPVDSLRPGIKLEAGTAVLTVSESAKACFSECVLFQAGECCKLSSGCVFLKIEATGNLRKGDKIVIIA